MSEQNDVQGLVQQVVSRLRHAATCNEFGHETAMSDAADLLERLSAEHGEQDRMIEQLVDEHNRFKAERDAQVQAARAHAYDAGWTDNQNGGYNKRAYLSQPHAATPEQETKR